MQPKSNGSDEWMTNTAQKKKAKRNDETKQKGIVSETLTAFRFWVYNQGVEKAGGGKKKTIICKMG